MSWTRERKVQAAIRAPMGPGLHRADTVVIERPGWYQLVTPSAPVSSLNEILLSELEPGEAEDAIDQALATYGALGKRVKWCVGPWTRPADFGERLTSRGFTSFEVRGMGVATDLEPARVPAEVEVVTVDEATLDDYLRVAMEGWSIPADQHALEREAHRAALARGVAALVLARWDGVPVGTGGVLLRDGYGYLMAAQVLAPARGRRVYRALVDARLGLLRARGLEYAVTQAREATSAPLLERLGFETLFRSAVWLGPLPTPG